MTGQLALRRALQGVRVLDASRVLAGPWTAQLLADLGADVIKIEQPGVGDETRGWGPPFVPSGEGGTQSAYFQSCNRGKRAVAIDLSKPKGQALFTALAKTADVVLENFRGSTAVKLGVDPQSLLKANARLIVCTISGFGSEGPYASRPGYDFVVQGMTGMMAATGPAKGEPHKVGVAVADVVTGLYAANAVQAALRLREASGHGYAIDVALFDCAAASMVNVAQAFLATGKAPARQGNAHLQIVPYEMFGAKDGNLVLAVGNDGQWGRFCAAAGKSDWASDSRFATNEARVRHRDVLVPLVGRLVATRTVAAWLEVLEKADVPAGPVWDVGQLLGSDEGQARHLKVTVKRPDGTLVPLMKSPLVGEAGADSLAPPALGQHTDSVLAEILGIGAAELARLRSAGVTA